MNKFYEADDFSMENFCNSFDTIYDLIYHDFIPEDYSLVEEFDYQLRSLDATFLKNFNSFRCDIVSSDREAQAFTMAYHLYESKYNF